MSGSKRTWKREAWDAGCRTPKTNPGVEVPRAAVASKRPRNTNTKDRCSRSQKRAAKAQQERTADQD